MFPEDLFDFVLTDVAEEIAAHPTPDTNPLPCDRWIARSCLQKAVRRGEVEVAQRALARLFADDPRNVWRHLVTISLEDLGCAGIDVLARVVAAARNRPARTKMGGEWVVASSLVRQMAESDHCQAACDLLLRALNHPAVASARIAALEADRDLLIEALRDEASPIERRAVAALALGGGLADEQRFHDPAPVFAVLGEQGLISHVIATCEAAWRISRNEMAFLLPLLWPSWMTVEPAPVRNDELPPVTMIGEVRRDIFHQKRWPSTKTSWRPRWATSVASRMFWRESPTPKQFPSRFKVVAADHIGVTHTCSTRPRHLLSFR